MNAYINKMACISPQTSFLNETPDFRILAHEEYLPCVEPNYREFIKPIKLRRMSKVVKMGIVCALSCANTKPIVNYDAILIGTGLGCLKDTENFLHDLHSNNESLLPPTSFIQSTHNTVSGQIALFLKSHALNFTFTQEQLSFESALLEALMLFEDDRNSKILIGGIDELTGNALNLIKDLECAKRSKTSGILPGEGSSFFELSGNKEETTIAKIDGIELVYNSKKTPEKRLEGLLDKCNLNIDDIDLILYSNQSTINDNHLSQFKDIPSINYKKFCGEFDTASSTALWMAAKSIQGKMYLDGEIIEGEKILILNQYRNNQHSFIVLTKC